MFKVGDIVVGLSGASLVYEITGEGCQLKVVSISFTGITFTGELLKASPGKVGLPGRIYDIESRYFAREGEIQSKTQKVEKIEVYQCEQGVRGYGACEETAEYRVTIPKLSITLCRIHGAPYASGKKRLELTLCHQCESVCKPGHIADQGHQPFCSDACWEAYHHPAEASIVSERI